MNSNSNTPSLDELLDAPLVDSSLGDISFDSYLDTELEATPTKLIPLVELEAGEIDPRLKLLSHSSRTLLHSCPRKYQLYRLSSEEKAGDPIKEAESKVTFAYGTAVGEGIQSTLQNKSEEKIILDTFLSWDTDLLAETPRQKKSFWLALFAVQKFLDLRSNGFLEEYQLVYYQGKPAVELSFLINLPNGFKYRGFVDAVLRHKSTGEIMVLELKTSSGTANSATYKNSGQAVGYSVVLDKLFPNLSSYTVLYLVYETRSLAYKELPFEKSLLQRALWLQELLIDTQVIELYDSYDTYPMQGHSCYNFFKECEYLGLCTLLTENLTKPLNEEMITNIEKSNSEFQFIVDFYDLVDSQIEKGEI